MEDPVEVELSRMVLQAKADQQCVYLRVCGGTRTFRIVIGFYEAAEIHRKVLGEKLHRPMTHDLIGRILAATAFQLTRVTITALRDDTFFAELTLTDGASERVVDCRPSDGIALAVQTGAKLFASREVLDAVAHD
jgi:bifunctional DNase/RNase